MASRMLFQVILIFVLNLDSHYILYCKTIFSHLFHEPFYRKSKKKKTHMQSYTVCRSSVQVCSQMFLCQIVIHCTPTEQHLVVLKYLIDVNLEESLTQIVKKYMKFIQLWDFLRFC